MWDIYKTDIYKSAIYVQKSNINQHISPHLFWNWVYPPYQLLSTKNSRDMYGCIDDVPQSVQDYCDSFFDTSDTEDNKDLITQDEVSEDGCLYIDSI